MIDPGEREERRWVPDNPDGSGWADVDWSSAAKGSRYHYRHVGSIEDERSHLPPFYRVVTRLESAALHPHENSYFVHQSQLADLLAEISLAGGAETIWHVEPCLDPPTESRVRGEAGEGGQSPRGAWAWHDSPDG